MAIDRKTVEHVAKLSRLELGEDEIETFTSQLARIVEYFDQLKELDVSKDEPTARAAEGALLREDEVVRSLPRGKALDGAPSARDGFFRVPPVIDDGASS